MWPLLENHQLVLRSVYIELKQLLARFFSVQIFPAYKMYTMKTKLKIWGQIPTIRIARINSVTFQTETFMQFSHVKRAFLR